ncbi:hydroxyacid oxidase 1-like [Branchiostoma floridae]|uniref:(S)-2-hydroxy-acid oxidase n=1 Tax=Branchiostoma floridae TaxID=7739 RepID=A0A9J7HGL9_BRAFL|nr:hydroxyacid oxidase 1-like [Branchiostoma floridae]
MAADSPELRRVEDFRKAAERTLPGPAWWYYSLGDGDNQTLRDNCESFKRYRVLPRVLRDVSTIDTTVSVLGSMLDFPVAISPTAHHKMAHPDGEKATARAAAAANTGMVLGLFANHSLEEVAEAAPQGTRWFNFVLFKDPERNRQLLERAARAGYKAIFLTVDQPRFEYLNQPKLTHKEKAKSQLFHGTGDCATLDALHVVSGTVIDIDIQILYFSTPNIMFPGTPPYGTVEYRSHLYSALKQPMTWDDVDWVKNNTSLPVVLKGILTAEDAKEAVRHGADAILVSNHGGRQLDGVPATIDVLPDIVGAVGGEAEVYLDGGVRTGTDVLKALALGARCVFIGRPAIWGLACNGENGLLQLLNVLKEELVYTMARTGCAEIGDINSTLVLHESYYSSRRGNISTVNNHY